MTGNTRRPLYKQAPKTNHKGLTGFFNRLYTGETGRPVDVEVEMVRNSQDTIIRHNLQNLSDFEPIDFYFPLALLVAIFGLRYIHFSGFFSILLLVVLIRDLWHRVHRRPSGPKATGLCDPYKRSNWWQALGIYAVSTPFLFGAGAINQWLLQELFPSPEMPVFTPDFSDEYSGSAFLVGLMAMGLLAFLLSFLELVVLAPLTEEIWFRGIGLAGFMKKTGSPLHSVIVTSIIFGILHGPRGVLFATLFGFVMALIRFRTGSLYCCMAMHALHNFIVLVIAIIMMATAMM